MISALQFPVSRSSFALRIASIDSFFEPSIKPHVLTMTTSASCASRVTCIPSRNNEPSMTSLSTRFFAQPRLTNPTLMGDDDMFFYFFVGADYIRDRSRLQTALTGALAPTPAQVLHLAGSTRRNQPLAPQVGRS